MSFQRTDEAARSRVAVLYRYFLASYVAVAVAGAPFLLRSWRGGAGADFYSVSLLLTYSALYLFPAVVITAALYFLLFAFRNSVSAPKARDGILYGCALLLVTVVEFALVVDGIVLREFGFHLNGFVFNLVTTPGGLESMGLGETLPLTCAAALLGMFAVQSGILWVAQSPRVALRLPDRRVYLSLLPVLLLLSSIEHLTYIVGDVRSDSEILAQANSFPFYQPMTARKLARKYGFEVERGDDRVEALEGGASPLDYPLHPIEIAAPQHPLNVVWLVGESLRWDALTPEIMPATSKLADESWSFLQHYSGGNGTRMGVFSMFYGLHGPYWFSFLNERRGPVLIDVLQRQDYQMHVSTSARFSYPEFDRTVFAEVPDRDLHDSADSYYSDSMDLGWKNDREHTGEIVDFLKTRDRSRPFFAYMFFESTHYRYYFPKGSEVREPYLKDMSLAALGADYDSTLLHNRYLNSAHHLDTQVERIVDALRETKDLDDTVVIVTGDHGEEFMEKGRNGHNSEFHDEQTHVPLVLWVPGASHRRIDDLTSHVDIAPTLMPLLGVSNASADYSLGHDLRSDETRAYAVVSDWSRIAILDHDYKLVVPVGGSGILESTELTTHDDGAVADSAEAFSSMRTELAQVMSDLRRFKTGANPAN